jgi:hypothetical protein
MRITGIGGQIILDGYFNVIGGNVTQFYETINGSTNFNNNIANTDGYFSYSSSFYIKINSMSYYISNPAYANFSLSNERAFDTSEISFFSDQFMYIGSENVSFATQLITDPTCFNEGTKILCLNKNFEEEYIPIENLRKGDLVKSYKHGYRKIDLIGKNIMINNPEKFNECMYKMEKTEENGLIEDLIVTGGHSILVDDLGNFKEENDKIFGRTIMIDDKYLLLSAVSNDFKKLENTDLYTYYHFILENNGNNDERFGVWANGILTETSSKKQFTNHKYTLL